jgi:hypothetical protein
MSITRQVLLMAALMLVAVAASGWAGQQTGQHLEACLRQVLQSGVHAP